jgi:hypothetical protein
MFCGACSLFYSMRCGRIDLCVKLHCQKFRSHYSKDILFVISLFRLII